jgi:hypothetical protein
MQITANVVQNDNNTIELALQAFQIGGQLGQAAGAAAWKSINDAATASGLPISAYVASDEGRKFAQQRLGGILGSIPAGRDPVTGAPKSWAPLTDRLLSSLAAPANMTPEQQKPWLQNETATGKVFLGEDGKWQVKKGLTPSESYYSSQAADILTRFQSKEAPTAPQTAPAGIAPTTVVYQGAPTVASLTAVPRAKPQSGASAQPVAQYNPIDWAMKTMVKYTNPGVTSAVDLVGPDGKVLKRAMDPTMVKPYLDSLVRTSDEKKTPEELAIMDALTQTSAANMKAAGYAQDAQGHWSEPKVVVPPKYANMANYNDGQLIGLSQSMSLPSDQRQLALDLLAERKRLGTPQASQPAIKYAGKNQTPQGAAPATLQGAGQAMSQGVNVAQTPPIAPTQAQGSTQPAPAGNSTQTFRQWLIAHPDVSKDMAFTRDPNAPDNAQLTAGAPMAYRRYQSEMVGNPQSSAVVSTVAVPSGSTGQSAGFTAKGLQTMSPQDYRAALMQANQATSEIRQLVKGVGKEIDNPMLASMYLPVDAQKYRANEIAMAAAGRQPEVTLSTEYSKQLQAQVDIMKMRSENMRSVLDNVKGLIQPFETELAKVVPLMQTDPKKAKEQLQRIEDSINSDPRTKGYFDTASMAIQALSGDYMKSLPAMFSSNDRRLLATYRRASDRPLCPRTKVRPKPHRRPYRVRTSQRRTAI